MITFIVKIKSIQRIPDLKLKPVQTRIIVKSTVQAVKDRVQKRHTDVFDSPMPPYSNKPVYVKVGRGFQNKPQLIGSGPERAPIASLAALSSAGLKILDAREMGRVSLKGRNKNKIVRTRNSVRFPNRAAYKRALGKSGLRDLTETGAMLNALGLVSQSGIYTKTIIIGFRSALQERKARGNAAITNWVGLSPIDEVKLLRLINAMFSENLGIVQEYQSTTKSFSTLTWQ